jgi:hypothetical protein
MPELFFFIFKEIKKLSFERKSYVFGTKWLNVDSKKKWFYFIPEFFGAQESNMVSDGVNFCLFLMVTVIFIELVIAVLNELGIHRFKSYEISLILFTALGVFYVALVLFGSLHKCSISLILFYIFSFRNKEELKDLEFLKTAINTVFFATFCATFYVESAIISSAFFIVSIIVYSMVKKQEGESIQSALWIFIISNILCAYLAEFDLLLLALVFRWTFLVLKLNYVTLSEIEKVNNVLFLKTTLSPKGPDQWISGNIKYAWRFGSKIVEKNPAGSFAVAASAGLFGTHELHKKVIVKNSELTSKRELEYRNSRMADLTLTKKQKDLLIEESISRERTAMAKACEPVSFVEYAIKKASEVWTS